MLIPTFCYLLFDINIGNSLPEITFPYLVGKLEAGELNFLKKMVEVYKPANMNKAVEDQESGKVIKPVIEWT